MHNVIPLETKNEISTFISSIVSTLQVNGIRFVCIDFDSTFISIHTGGIWRDTPDKLRTYVREFFLLLIPMLYNIGIPIAIVTFSPQVLLISQVLELCFTQEIVDSIIIRGNDSSWNLDISCIEKTGFYGPDENIVWNGMYTDRKYKLAYVVSAVQQLYTRQLQNKRCIIRNFETILFDDDPYCIRVAIDHGITGVHFENTKQIDLNLLYTQIQRLTASNNVQENSQMDAEGMYTNDKLLDGDAVVFTPPRRKWSTSSSTSLGYPSLMNHNSIPVTPDSSITHYHVARSRRHHTGKNASNGSRLQQSKKVVPKVMRFCTPSPVTKLKLTVDMGRPKSKRTMKLRPATSRSIANDFIDLALQSIPERSLSSQSSVDQLDMNRSNRTKRQMFVNDSIDTCDMTTTNESLYEDKK